MNISTLKELIEQFNTEIIQSGFKRDIQDYLTSITKSQNNIVALREIGQSIFDKLESFKENNFEETLKKLFPSNSPEPFTESSSYTELKELIENKEIQQTQFFQKLKQIVTQLNTSIQSNVDKAAEIESFFAPYIDEEKEFLAEENKAIVSIIFKETKTITNLKQFTKTITAWNRILPVYHQILKSESPEDIEIIQVQNGSIDFLFNIDLDIALDLTELFNEGFKYFLGYISYKTLAKPIAKTFFGNKELEAKQQELENSMLDNLLSEVIKTINNQHKSAKKRDKNLPSNISKMVTEVAKLVTSHIINGNEIKLLSIPENEGNKEKGEKSKESLIDTMKDLKNALKKLPQAELQKLLDKYGELPDEE